MSNILLRPSAQGPQAMVKRAAGSTHLRGSGHRSILPGNCLRTPPPAHPLLPWKWQSLGPHTGHPYLLPDATGETGGAATWVLLLIFLWSQAPYPRSQVTVTGAYARLGP